MKGETKCSKQFRNSLQTTHNNIEAKPKPPYYIYTPTRLGANF